MCVECCVSARPSPRDRSVNPRHPPGTADARRPAETSEDEMKRRVGLDDQVLVEKLRARDRTAQSELFSRLRKALWRPASRIVGNGSLADDVIQEAWIHAVVGIDSFQGRSRFGTWLASIVLNKARCHRRRGARCRPFSAIGPAGPGPG